jgi:hypothetical protein
MDRQLYIGPVYLGDLREVNLVTSNPFTERKSLARLDDVLTAALAERIPVMFTATSPEHTDYPGLFVPIAPIR